MPAIPEEIGRELSAEEQINWSGQPRQGLVVRGTDAFLIPFSLLWCGFAIFWEINVINAPNAPIIFTLWGVPFVLVGIYFVVGRFITDAVQRSRTFYAVTTDRILIISGLFNRKIKSLDLRTLAEISLEERYRGEGTISFGSGSTNGGFAAWPGMGAHVAPCFDLVAEAKSVFEVIRDAQRKSA